MEYPHKKNIALCFQWIDDFQLLGTPMLEGELEI